MLPNKVICIPLGVLEQWPPPNTHSGLRFVCKFKEGRYPKGMAWFFFFPWSVGVSQIAKFGGLWLLLEKALTHYEYRPGSFYCCWSGRWWGRKWRRNRPFQSRRSRRQSSLPASHSFCQPECFYRYLQSRGSEFEKDETLLQCLCEKGLEEGVTRALTSIPPAQIMWKTPGIQWPPKI